MLPLHGGSSPTESARLQGSSADADDSDDVGFYALKDSTDSFLRKRRKPAPALDEGTVTAASEDSEPTKQACTPREQPSEGDRGSANVSAAGSDDATDAGDDVKSAGGQAVAGDDEGVTLRQQHVAQLAISEPGGVDGVSAQGGGSCNATTGAHANEVPASHSSEQAASLRAWKLSPNKQSSAPHGSERSGSGDASSCLITTAVDLHATCSVPGSAAAQAPDDQSRQTICASGEAGARSVPVPAGMELCIEEAQATHVRALLAQLQALAPARVAARPDAVAADIGVERYLGMAQAAQPAVLEAALHAHALRLAVEDRLLAKACALPSRCLKLACLFPSSELREGLHVLRTCCTRLGPTGRSCRAHDAGGPTQQPMASLSICCYRAGNMMQT